MEGHMSVDTKEETKKIQENLKYIGLDLDKLPEFIRK